MPRNFIQKVPNHFCGDDEKNQPKMLAGLYISVGTVAMSVDVHVLQNSKELLSLMQNRQRKKIEEDLFKIP
jgi:hypothetical protein